MDISVVVPLYNEEESLPELFAWIERVMKAHDFSYEVIFVNDGSTDRRSRKSLRMKNRWHSSPAQSMRTVRGVILLHYIVVRQLKYTLMYDFSILQLT